MKNLAEPEIDRIVTEQADDDAAWKKIIRVMGADGKGRLLKTYEEEARLKDYDQPIRQLAIAGRCALSALRPPEF